MANYPNWRVMQYNLVLLALISPILSSAIAS